MQRFNRSRALGLSMIIYVIAAPPILAAETVTYQYDALGRLAQASKAGGPKSGTKTDTSYDPGGNRSCQSTTGVPGGAATTGCTPPPPPVSPPPPPPASAPTFSISDADAVEGASASFTVTKTGQATASLTVNYATAIGTATTLDFTAISGTLTFAANETVKYVSVATKTDTLTESDEVFYVNLSLPSAGSSITDNQGVATILDNEPLCNGRPCGP